MGFLAGTIGFILGVIFIEVLLWLTEREACITSKLNKQKKRKTEE